jgi:hypothetical protein
MKCMDCWPERNKLSNLVYEERESGNLYFVKIVTLKLKLLPT